MSKIPPLAPGYRLIQTPQPDFTGERYGVFFRNGYAQVDPTTVLDYSSRDNKGHTLLIEELLWLGYTDVTPPDAILAEAK